MYYAAEHSIEHSASALVSAGQSHYPPLSCDLCPLPIFQLTAMSVILGVYIVRYQASELHLVWKKAH